MRTRLIRHLKIGVLPAAIVLLSVSGSGATVTGGTTSVALDAGTVTALTGLGFSIAPVSPATLSGATATFPITGGDTTTVIDHAGGLAFTKGGTTADIENFAINLSGVNADTITGSLVAGGMTAPGVKLFDIGAAESLTLDPQLASDLSSAFGVPNLSGAAVGTATVNATTAATTPEPSTFGLGIAAILSVAYFLRRRARTAVKVSSL